MTDIQDLVDKVHHKVKKNKGGKVATYIPQLAKANPNLFGICLVLCDGTIHEAGNSRDTVAIESISKVFSLSMAVEELGIETVNKKIGNMGSSLPFNSVIAAVLTPSHTVNPFVNQGAIATTSLFYKKDKKAFRNKILENMDKYAGRKLPIDEAVYHSEGATNSTNMALAYLLKSYNRFYGNVDETVDTYTAQCSKRVSAKDLATMACVFATGGIHPETKKRIISDKTARYVYRALHGEGLYEFSAKWDTDVGGHTSAKSGVGGGIFVIIKGIGGIGIVSPPLDKIGNSVRGIEAGALLSDSLLKLNDLHRSYKKCRNKSLTMKKTSKKHTNKKTKRRV